MGAVYVCHECFNINRGQVHYSKDTLIFKFELPFRSSQLKDRTLQGLLVGEDFGFSIASCDINGDGRDDLIVGAPSYAEDQYQYNVGRIHVFVFNKQSDTLQRVRLGYFN